MGRSVRLASAKKNPFDLRSDRTKCWFNMETAYLATFMAVLESGSMSEAARRLNLTATAIAQQMRVLERELGAPLLKRAGRTVRPTEAGHRLAERAQPLLAELAGLRSAVGEQAGALELTVGATNTMLHGLLPMVLDALVSEHPAARIVVRPGLTAELYDQVLRRQLDVALCLHPPFVLPKTLHWVLLREERLVVIAPQSMAHRDPHELLRSEPLIRYDRRLGGGQAAERYMRRAGIVPRERFEISSLAAIAMLVGRGVGVSIAPDATTAWWSALPVARLALPQAAEARRFGMVWPRASPRTRAIEVLAAHAQRVVADALEATPGEAPVPRAVRARRGSRSTP
jgi:DNA-binding transcriptional LysR family regulator